jgi:hypothetical protein
MLTAKKSTKNIAAAFTDNLAVVYTYPVRIKVDTRERLLEAKRFFTKGPTDMRLHKTRMGQVEEIRASVPFLCDVVASFRQT